MCPFIVIMRVIAHTGANAVIHVCLVVHVCVLSKETLSLRGSNLR